jgi:hypothetical protein
MSGPTKKQLASRHMRRLRTMREQVLDMARQWGDVDQFCANVLQDLADAMESSASNLLEDDEAAGDRP